jgi:hypothetical protein
MPQLSKQSQQPVVYSAAEAPHARLAACAIEGCGLGGACGLGCA